MLSRTLQGYSREEHSALADDSGVLCVAVIPTGVKALNLQTVFVEMGVAHTTPRLILDEHRESVCSVRQSLDELNHLGWIRATHRGDRVVDTTRNPCVADCVRGSTGSTNHLPCRCVTDIVVVFRLANGALANVDDEQIVLDDTVTKLHATLARVSNTGSRAFGA